MGPGRRLSTASGLVCAVLIGIACNHRRPADAGSNGIKPISWDSAEAKLVSPTGSTALWVLSPQECFACNRDLSDWLRVAGAGTGRLFILLSSRPSDGERKTLTVLRLPIAGVLVDTDVTADSMGSSLYLYEDGRLRARISSTDTSGVRAALRRFARSVSGDDVSSVPSAARTPRAIPGSAMKPGRASSERR